ncbi:hypothetical protein BH23VER1_BH23VER1_26750 [soil metagenome]
MAKSPTSKKSNPTRSAAPNSQASPASKAAKKGAPAKKSVKKSGDPPLNGSSAQKSKAEPKQVKVTAFAKKQQQKLLELRDSLVDQMAGVTRETLRNHAEGSDSSAFGMHQADAGSDAYDRDFALNLLSKEQDALYEIEEALKRVKEGRYGICEASGKPIGQPRLEAIPFARFTVECQAQIERDQVAGGYRRPMRSLFGLEDGGEGDENNRFSEGDSVDKREK